MSFTIDQVKAAHAKVKSGADFPAYIRDIKQLGVTQYHAYVTDGHVNYFGNDNYSASAPAKYSNLQIADASNADTFKADLKAHQHGHTDYVTFCNDCAKSGIEKWTVSIDDMTCTYYDMAGNEILVERIPG